MQAAESTPPLTRTTQPNEEMGSGLDGLLPKALFMISIAQNKDIFAQREKVLCIIYKRLREYSKTMHGG
jgi:hypothetical protein